MKEKLKERSLVVKNLFSEMTRFLNAEESERNVLAMKKLLRQTLRAIEEIEEHHTRISWELYNWINKPAPSVVPENTELRQSREKLERKERRMRGKRYRERFVTVWYKEWDEEKKYPLREFRSEDYYQEMEKIWRQIRDLKQLERDDKARRVAEAVQKELNELLNVPLVPFLETKAEMNDADLKTLQYIVHMISAEYFLEFTKRICSILSLEIKKHGRWTEKSLALAKFILSLKEKINRFSDHVDARILVLFHDIISGAELFVVETNNWITEKERQEYSRRELVEAIEAGFQKTVNRLVSVENSLKTINKSVLGLGEKLSDIAALNRKILESTKENSDLMEMVSSKIDLTNERLSSINKDMWLLWLLS